MFQSNVEDSTIGVFSDFVQTDKSKKEILRVCARVQLVGVQLVGVGWCGCVLVCVGVCGWVRCV